MSTNYSFNDLNCQIYEENATHDLTNFTVVRFVFGTLYCMIFCLGVLGNGCLIMALMKFRHLRTVRNLFILNLSISDTLVCFVSLPVTSYQILYKNWIFGEFFCHIIPVLQGTSIIISTFTLTCIAIDRFILIVFPQRPPINKCCALTMIVTVWLLGIGGSTPSGINSKVVSGNIYHFDPPLCGEFCDEIGWQSYDPSFRQIYGTALLVVQFALPLTIITICYSAMFLKLKARARSTLTRNEISCENHLMVPLNCEQNERRRAKEKRRQRTNLMLVLMVCLFGITWFPHVVLNVLKDVDIIPKFMEDQMYLYSLIAHCIAMTSTFCNVFLYGFMNETFRIVFGAMLCGGENGNPRRRRIDELSSVEQLSVTTRSLSRN